jgi:peptidoglycan/LPS O-acetylase OafA/YrhL
VAAAAIARQLTLVWLLPFVFSLCVVTFASERGLVSDLLTTAFFQRAGELSYAIYLVHFAWVGLFYAAGTAAAKLPALGAFAERVSGNVIAPAGFFVYLFVVWISASVVTRLASAVHART